jgi:hypothetical protein
MRDALVDFPSIGDALRFVTECEEQPFLLAHQPCRVAFARKPTARWAPETEPPPSSRVVLTVPVGTSAADVASALDVPPEAVEDVYIERKPARCALIAMLILLAGCSSQGAHDRRACRCRCRRCASREIVRLPAPGIGKA